jgi:hypothetical protein
MTQPLFPRIKERSVAPLERNRLLLKGVSAVILTGGLLLAAVAFFIQKKNLAFGLFLGSLLSILNFYSLHALAGRVLKLGDRGGKVFWFWTLFRWVIAASVCWALTLISPSCLLGALGGYLWALAVLGWSGWRNAAAKPSSHRLEKD